MTRAQTRWRLGGYLALGAVAAVALALVLAPGAVGRLLGDLWVTTMGAVLSLLGGVFSG